MQRALRILITAGPTHEPIDRVRYIGNRSSGRMGVSLLRASLQRGHDTTLLLGPTNVPLQDAPGNVHRFHTAAELEALLLKHFPACDVLIMAAAVADYRPRANSEPKIRRTYEPLTLVLDPVPDLLAQCSHTRGPGQFLVGFALEPEAGLIDVAREKLVRKGVDAIVANSLETMDSELVDAFVVWRGVEGAERAGVMRKERFAEWLIDRIVARVAGAGL